MVGFLLLQACATHIPAELRSFEVENRQPKELFMVQVESDNERFVLASLDVDRSATSLPYPSEAQARLFEVMPYPRVPRYFRRHWW
jgi:hypothetical protein